MKSKISYLWTIGGIMIDIFVLLISMKGVLNMNLNGLHTLLQEQFSQLPGEFILEEDHIQWIYETEAAEDGQDERWDIYCEVRKAIETLVVELGFRITEMGDYDQLIYLTISEALPMD